MLVGPHLRSKAVLGWLIAAVFLTLATRLPYLGHAAADYDEQLYSLMGQGILDGQIPYVDMWDRKPPGLFLLFALFHWLGGPGPLAYQVPALLACLGGAWFVYRVALRLTDPVAAAISAALYPVLMALYGSASGQSEIFYVPLIVGMALLLLQADAMPAARAAFRRMVAAMAIGGLVLQLKYTALPICLVLGLLALASLRRRGIGWPRIVQAAAVFGALGIAPTALAAAWYAGASHWDAFVFANFLSARMRQSMPLDATLKMQSLYALPLLVLVSAGAIVASRQGRRRSPCYLAAAAWLLAGVAGLFMGTTVYVYYYAALVPPAILLATPLFAAGMRLGRWMAVGVLAWLALSLHPLGAAEGAQRECRELAAIVAAIAPRVTGRAGDLFVYDGPSVLYRLAGTQPPGLLVYPDHLNNALEDGALPLDPATETARILNQQPRVIVTTPVPFALRNKATETLVLAALAGDYRRLDTVAFQDRPIEIWVRR